MTCQRAIKSFYDRFDDAVQNTKVKSIINFDLNCSSNFKSLTVKNQNEIKVTIRLLSGNFLCLQKFHLQALSTT